MKRWHSTLAGTAVVLALFTACGSETMISGIGNSGNRIGATGLLEELAEELARNEQTPQVSDDELAQAFAAIRDRALEGDPTSAFLLLRVAAHQRETD
jgi:hypothetical protein